MSSAVTSYVGSVAPGMSAQAAPEASQRSHWWVNVIVGEPVHVPWSAVSVCAVGAACR